MASWHTSQHLEIVRKRQFYRHRHRHRHRPRTKTEFSTDRLVRVAQTQHTHTHTHSYTHTHTLLHTHTHTLAITEQTRDWVTHGPITHASSLAARTLKLRIKHSLLQHSQRPTYTENEACSNTMQVKDHSVTNRACILFAGIIPGCQCAR